MPNLSERDVRTAIQELEVAWRSLDGADLHTFESALADVTHALDEVATREVLSELPPTGVDVAAWIEQRNREYSKPLQLPAMGIPDRTAFLLAILRNIEQTREDKRMGLVIAVGGITGRSYAVTYERFTRVIVRPFVAEVRRRLVAKLPETAPSASGGTIVYNLSGPNARVNVNSTDGSVNIVSVDRRQLFDAMRRTADEAPVDASLRVELRDRIAALEVAQAGSGFMHYRELIGTIADHAALIALFAPYLPALAQLFTS